jgi:RNase P subunit RPR2
MENSNSKNNGSGTNSEAVSRLNFLYQAAYAASCTGNEGLARFYAHTLKKLASKTVTRLY